jgi:predicted CopG family antitoxin
MPSIKVDGEVYGRLVKLRAQMMLREGRNMTFSEVLRRLLDEREGVKG